MFIGLPILQPKRWLRGAEPPMSMTCCRRNRRATTLRAMREPLVTPPTQRVSASLFNRTRGLAEIANISTCTPVAPRPDMGKQSALTHRVLRNIRTPDTMTANRACLDYPPESHGWHRLAAGLRGSWGGLKLPPPNLPAANYRTKKKKEIEKEKKMRAARAVSGSSLTYWPAG